jgi:hypothetical protein
MRSTGKNKCHQSKLPLPTIQAGKMNKAYNTFFHNLWQQMCKLIIGFGKDVGAMAPEGLATPGNWGQGFLHQMISFL